ncbi:MAG: hypothetical protein NT045_06735, partial [Candidatus Aureabacteria bacterium]|nr:hypothetical protein [Candidatus Auribacterota bacterium]
MSLRSGVIVISLFITAIIVALAFLPSLRNGFVNYDDDRYVYRNPLITELSWASIGRIFRAADYTVLYTPLVFLSYSIEYHRAGLHPFLY